jgi:hypothetical protein
MKLKKKTKKYRIFKIKLKMQDEEGRKKGKKNKKIMILVKLI